tara:strand:- start:12010 stop:12180 length:171 start_codon:yes stop_codon:yes gene_type:complete
MRLARALKEKTHDVRLRDKLISEGKIKKEEVDKLLKELPDESANVRYTGEAPTQQN